MSLRREGGGARENSAAEGRVRENSTAEEERGTGEFCCGRRQEPGSGPDPAEYQPTSGNTSSWEISWIFS